MNLLFLFIKLLGFWIEIWLITVGIKSSNFNYTVELSGYMYRTGEKFNSFRKHLLPIIEYSFSTNSYACLIWIFIFDTDRAQIYSVQWVGLLETVSTVCVLFISTC
jgi:hypothetical protein